MPTVAAPAPTRTTWTVPQRVMTAPVVGSASREPMAIESSTRPSWPLVSSKLDRTSGIRETQLAKTSPLRKKVSPTALRAAVRVGTGTPRRADAGGARRIVSIESIRW